MSKSMLRMPALEAKLGSCRSTIYTRVNQGLLPNFVILGPRMVGLPSYEVDAIIDARISGKSDDEIRKLVIKLLAARKSLA